MESLLKILETSVKENKLYDLAKGMKNKITDTIELDKPIAKQIEVKTPNASLRDSFLPKSDGEWTGEKGDSEWKPDPEKVPGKSNPEGKTWEDILDKYDIDGIKFKDGEPDFSDISRGTVEIGDFTESRDKNFVQADEAEAKKRGCTPDEVAKWRKENGHTWHERSDCETMDKVPSEVHNNIPHSGGIAEKKKENLN